MLVYAVAVCFILFMAWLYVWERLIETASLAEPLRQTVLGFFVIAYGLQAARWLLFRLRGDLSWLIGPAYFSFGLLTHLFLTTLLKDFLSFSWWVVAPQSYLQHAAWINSWVSYVIFFVCLAASLWGAQNAYEGPVLKTAEITEDPNGRTLTIAQISDLHVGPIIKKPYVENVVRMVNELDADVIVVTGDLGDGDPEALEDDLAPLANLKSRMGVYYVTGNHEYYWKVNGWIHAVKSVGMNVLFNAGVLLPGSGRPIWLAGVPDISAHRIRPDHVHNPDLAAEGAPANAYKILLAHQPHSIYAATKAGFNLVLSGHTHGGQYIPFTWVVGWFNPYSKGLHRHAPNTHIYVNLGTGFWGPPLRLGATSEITLLKLKV